MVRGLDHVVHVVRDLEAAGELYDLLGFTVGTRNHHSWGTHNRIVQTPGFFMELLEVAEPEKIPAHEEGTFSFGAFNRDFLATIGPGLSMLVLEGKDPAAEKAAFDVAGFGGLKLFDFARTGRRPDGSDVQVAFTLAFAREASGQDAAFFTCRQHIPENFWSLDLQRHMNGTTSVAGVVLTAEDVEAHLAFMECFVGAPFRRATTGWHIAETPRGKIELMSTTLFKQRFGDGPSQPDLRIAAVRFAVANFAAARKRVASSRMSAEEIEGLLVIGPRAGLGATLVFEPET